MSADPHSKHDRQVVAVADAVAKLLTRLEPSGFTPEAIFEGAVKGGAIALMAGTSATPNDIAKVLMDFAGAFDSLDKPTLTVVK